MTLAAERKRAGRMPIKIIEADLDFCTRTFGTSPCLATTEKYDPPPSLLATLAGDETLTYGTGPITSTRSSTAYYFDASGILQSAATDELRFETDPSDSVVRALIEERRSNLFSANHRLASDWTLASGTGTKADTGTGIDNAANSCVVLSDTDNANYSAFRISGTITADTNTSAFLFYVAKNQTYIPLIQFTFGNDVVGSAYLDTATGDLSTDSTAGITVKERGNFWELRFAGPNTNSKTAIRIFCYPCYRATVNGANDVTLTGSCTVDWPQGEYNVPWSTSPIDGAGTREDDVDSVPNAEIPTLSAGAVLGATASVPNDGSARTILAAISGTGDTYIQRGTSGVLEGKLGGVTFTTTTTPDTGPHDIYMVTDGTNHYIYVDGTQVHSFTGSLTQPTGALYIGSKSGTSDHLNGLIGNVIAWSSYQTTFDTIQTTRCYNTRATCKYVAAYATTAKTYRWVEDVPNFPITINAIPCVRDISTAPTRVDPDKGLGYRATFTARLKDFPHHDRGIDPYLSTRSYTPSEQGTYFGKLKARNPYYQGRELRLLSGYLAEDGSYSAANFETHTFIIDSIDGPDSNGNVTIKARDMLSKTDFDKGRFPPANSETLSAAYTAGSSTTLVLQSGEGSSFTNDPWGTAVSVGNPGYVRISDNILKYTGVSTDTLTGVVGGQLGSTDSNHSIDDKVQACAKVDGNIVDVVEALLETGASINVSYIDTTGNAAEKAAHLSAFTLDGIITKPEGIGDLIGDMVSQSLCYIFWDERNQLIKIKAVAPYSTDTELYETNHFISCDVRENPRERLSRLIVNYGIVDHVNPDKQESYLHAYVHIDAEAELSTKYGEVKEKIVNSRWYQSAAPIVQFASRMQKWRSFNPKIADFKLDAKDGALWTSSPIDINSDAIQDFDGSQLASEFFIIEAEELPDGVIKYKAMNNPFFGRYAVVMANGTADYAGDNIGGWIAPTSSGFSDGEEAFKIA